VNNEVGTIQPLKEIAAVAAKRKIPVHTDAVQAIGKIPASVAELGVSMLSASAHKFHGPKGVGLLYVKLGTPFRGVQTGGHHEQNRRAGTENVPGIIGFAKALELAAGGVNENAKKIAALRDKLERGVLEKVRDAVVNGDRKRRVPHISNIGFRYIEGEGIILSLSDEGICVASGSACTSASLEPSHVLTAMGVAAEHAHGSIRFSLSDETSAEDVEYATAKVAAAVERLRAMSPLYKEAASCPDGEN
jgi:cysteine desulfurase